MRRIQRPRLSAVCALLALLLAGCGATSSQRVQSAPQPTQTPAPTLTWKAVTLPEGVSIAHAGWVVSPADGHDAWLCAPGDRTNQFVVWATQDAGVSWKQTGTFSYAAPEQASCMLVADQASTRSLVATLTWGSGEAGTLQSACVYSSDGGAHWTHAPIIRELATGASGVLALTSSGVVVSMNGFQTWRNLPPASLATNDAFFRFWLAPDGSMLLAASYDGTLWRTDDLGAHWTKIPTPEEQTDLAVWLSASHTFYMCGWSGGSTLVIHCSDDMGVHWSSVPSMTETSPCSKCGIGVTSQTTACPPWSIAPDGSLLTMCGNSGSSQTGAPLYRLAPHTEKWLAIGTAPAMFDSVPATGPVWCVTATPDVATGMDTATLPF